MSNAPRRGEIDIGGRDLLRLSRILCKWACAVYPALYPRQASFPPSWSTEIPKGTAIFRPSVINKYERIQESRLRLLSGVISRHGRKRERERELLPSLDRCHSKASTKRHLWTNGWTVPVLAGKTEDRWIGEGGGRAKYEIRWNELIYPNIIRIITNGSKRAWSWLLRLFNDWKLLFRKLQRCISSPLINRVNNIPILSNKYSPPPLPPFSPIEQVKRYPKFPATIPLRA